MPTNNPRLKFKNNIARDPETKIFHIRRKFDGHAVQKGGFRTKGAALQFLDWLELQYSTGQTLRPAPTITVACDEYFDYLKLKGGSSETVRDYQAKFKRIKEGLGADTRLDRISQTRIDDYIRLRQLTVSNGTINKDQTALRTLYKHQDIRPRWKARPLQHTKKHRTIFSVEKIRALWNAIDPSARLGIGLCLLAGLRAGAALKIRASAIDGDLLRVPAAIIKTREDFVTYLVPTLAELLPTDADPDDYLVFPEITGPRERASHLKEITNQYTRLLRAASKTSGTKFQGIGHFRHHCASFAGELGDGTRFNREDIKWVTMHSDGSVTARYNQSQGVALKKNILTAVENYIFPEATS